MSDAFDRTIHALFEAQVERTPNAVAFMQDHLTITYEELNRRANCLAHHLLEHGIRSGDIVSVCLPRSIDMMAATLGIMKAGAAYLPLDSTLTSERICEISSQRGVALLVNNGATAGQTSGAGVQRMSLDAVPVVRSYESAVTLKSRANGTDTCCVLFTSGTTAQSRGVLQTHDAVLTRFDWMWSAYPFHPSDVTVVHRSSMVIGSLWDGFGALLAGIPAVVVPVSAGADIEPLWNAIATRGVTRVSASVSLWRALVDRAQYDRPSATNVRVGISAGEVLDWELVKRWKRAFPNGRMLNVYGATECNTPLTYDTSEMEEEEGPVSVGRATTGANILIFDEGMQCAPTGAVGELHVSGRCLAAGYLNAPEITAQRFVRAPSEQTSGERLFRTGDLARLMPDGNVEVVGRCDHQVKVLGFRVDLLEVERALSRCPGVRRVAVTASDPIAGMVKLTAHLIATQPDLDWRARLRPMLPDYMIPASFIFVETLPLTPSGKIDRLALQKCDSQVDHRLQSPLRRSKHEPLFVAMLEELLQIDRVDLSKSFEALGGHSLAATRLVLRLRHEWHVDTSIDELFSAIPLEALLNRIESVAGSAQQNTPAFNGGSHGVSLL